MPLFISATSIKDFLSCEKKLFYRINFPESAVIPDNVAVGTYVHEVLEKFWDNKKSAISFLRKRTSGNVLKSCEEIVDTFFSDFHFLCSKADKIEFKFKIAVAENVFVIGKIDRMTANGVIDWKTSGKSLRSISKDVQFMLYHWAFETLNHRKPAYTSCVNLTTKEILSYKYDDALMRELHEFIIPSTISKIKSRQFSRVGMLTGKCGSCLYKKRCLEDYRNVMVNRIPT